MQYANKNISIINANGLKKYDEDGGAEMMLNPTNQTLNKAVQNVLLKFEQDKELPLSPQWREKFEKRELPISDAVGLLFVAIERGYLKQ